MDTQTLYGDEPPTSWVQARNIGIGGSDAAAVLGLNPWCSPYTLWCRKTGLLEPIKQTEGMAWGHRLEGVIADYYAEQTGFEISESVYWRVPDGDLGTTAIAEEYVDGILSRNRERPWQLASVDRLVRCPDRGWGVLEIKNVGEYSRKYWDDGVPDYVRVQNLHYQSVLGLTWGAVAVLFGGKAPGFMDVVAEDGELERLVTAESAFWDSLARGEAPAPDGSESTRATVGEIFPAPEEGQSVTLPDDALMWDREHIEHKRLEKEHRTKARGFETLIRAQMGSAEVASLPSGVVWRSTRVGDTLVEEHTRKGYRKYSRREPRKKR